MKIKLLIIFILFFIDLNVECQESYKNILPEDSVKIYVGGNPYPVKSYPWKFKSEIPKNIIMMIGDGMGVAHVFAGITANHGHLFLENFMTGFSRTQSADNYVTDSAAGGTALSIGEKTYKGAIGVKADTLPVKTVLEYAEEKGKETGLVSISTIVHATPAAFVSHQADREQEEAIAEDFLKSGIDVFIGGGYKCFKERKDGRDLTEELKQKGYRVLQDMDQIIQVKSGKLAGLTAPRHNGRLSERGNMLPLATRTAINILCQNQNGFFLMVEGSAIDWGGHKKNTQYLVEEVLDFDRAVGEALEFAASNGETLIVVTADHETGGFALLDGNMQTGMVKGDFITNRHTGVMVPVFAYGPGASQFSRIMENTDIARSLIEMVTK